MYRYGGLGRLICEKCLDPNLSKEKRKWTVAFELAKALNGVFKTKAYEQNVFSRRAALRSGGSGSTCAKLGGPLVCEPAHLPPRVSVKVYYRKGYPYTVLGRVQGPSAEGGRSGPHRHRSTPPGVLGHAWRPTGPDALEETACGLPQLRQQRLRPAEVPALGHRREQPGGG